MTDAEVKEYLRDNGYPEHVVSGGRAGLIHKWKEFVKQVEHGYPHGLEDYRNDLDVRAIITLAGGEDAEVKALDERLKKQLTATDIRVWESAAGAPFWDFGYPKIAGKDLMEDLRGEELIR